MGVALAPVADDSDSLGPDNAEVAVLVVVDRCHGRIVAVRGLKRNQGP